MSHFRPNWPTCQLHRAAFLVVATWLGTVSVTFADLVQVGLNFTGSVSGADSTAQPADADGAVGLAHFAEFINGRFSVYDKQTGQRVKTMTDLSFWSRAGVSIPGSMSVTDPRIVFDAVAQRWFVSMIDFSLTATHQSRNRFLFAVSGSADPTGEWHGFGFTADPINGDFADFPTLGVNDAGVYLGADMFTPTIGLHIGSTLVFFPKSDLLANPPVFQNYTSAGIQTLNARGFIFQPSIATGSGIGPEPVLAVGSLGLDSLSHTTLVLSAVSQLGPPLALSRATNLSVPGYDAPPDPTQPGHPGILDPGDARFSASVRQVGNLLYAVHAVSQGGRGVVRWYQIDANSSSVLQTGTVSDPNLDLFYPSIAANAFGTVVIGCNGSGAKTNVSCYAAIGRSSNGTLSFGGLIQLKAGLGNFQYPDTTGVSRWGDYSATTVDPLDPTRFWTIQLYPVNAITWATQITEIITGLHLLIVPTSSGAELLWSASPNVQLQQANALPPLGSWTPVTAIPTVVNGRAKLSLPILSGPAYFRLTQ